MNSPTDTVLSLGAGVQSSALALMAAYGELDLTGIQARAVTGPKGNRRTVILENLTPPTVAIFADTGWEPAEVYRHLERLEADLAAAPYPIRVVHASAGNLRDDLVDAAAGRRKRVSNPPLYVRRYTGRDQATSDGMLSRNCTRDYKVRPIRRALRDLGYGPLTPALRDLGYGSATSSYRPVASLVGISVDEWQRVKPGDGWQAIAHPLVDLRITRDTLARYLLDRGYEPVKSACLGCPYRSAAGWRAVQQNPAEWEDTLLVDRAIRQGIPGGQHDAAYLTDQRVPLADLDLRTIAEKGQDALFEDDSLFLAECEGLCRV